MKKYWFLLLAGIAAAQPLCGSEYTRIEESPGQKYFWLKGAGKSLAGVSSEPKTLYRTVKTSLQPEYIEIDTNEFFEQAGAKKVRVSFFPGKEFQAAGKTVTASVGLSCNRNTSAMLSIEGSRSSKHRHYWTAQTMPVSTEKETLEYTHSLPEDVNAVFLRVDLTGPGIYRFYHGKLQIAGELPIDSSINYILNGGAERGWYATAMHGFNFRKMWDDHIVSDGWSQFFRRFLSVSLDDKEKYSGRYSFKIVKERNAGGHFYLNPVPFVPGKSASLTCRIKGTKRHQQVILTLTLANGIEYGKKVTVGPEWKPYEFYIPAWGKKAPEGWMTHDTASIPGGSRLRLATPSIQPEGTIWIDDIAYSIGGHSRFQPKDGITATAALDVDKQYYLAGQKVRSILSLSNLSSTEKTAVVTWEMKDFFGKTVKKSSKKEKITVPAGGQAGKEFIFTPPENLRGAMNLLFDVNGEKTGLYFGVIEKPGPLNHRIGMNYLSGRGDVSKAIPMLKDFRIGALRLWSHFRGVANTGFRDVPLFHDNGFYIMMCIATALGHAPEYFVPSDFSGWQKEIGALAKFYEGKIQMYEILNESNIWAGRTRNPDPAKYLEMNIKTNVKTIAALADAIKASDPNALIAGPASCHTDISWTSGVLAEGGAKYLDAVTEHPYRQRPELPDYETELQSLHKLAGQYKKDFPLISSESGAVSTTQYPENNQIPAHARTQVAYNTRMMLIALANGVKQHYHFCFAFDQQNAGWQSVLQGNPGNNHHPIPSPVMFACRNAADRLEDAKPLERVKLGNNYRCYLFDRGDARIAAVWKWNGKPDSMELSPELSRTSKLYDVMGSRLNTGTLELGAHPFYIESPLSAQELKKAILNSKFSAQGDVFDAALMITGEKKFALNIRNLSHKPISGSVTINGRNVPFKEITPEGSEKVIFHTEKAISMDGQPVKAEIDIPSAKQKKTLTLNLKAILAPYAAKAPAVDGDLSDWPANAKEIPLTKTTRLKNWTGAENGIRATARFTWDKDYFYLAVTVFKKDYVESDVGVSGLWQADGIQFAFDPVRNATRDVKGYQDDDFEYAAALVKNQPVVFRNYASAATYDSLDKSKGVVEEVKRAIRVLPGKTIYELAFPRQSVSPFRLQEGEAMRINVLVNIGNQKGRAGFLQLTPGIGEAPKMPGEFIDLVLQK